MLLNLGKNVKIMNMVLSIEQFWDISGGAKISVYTKTCVLKLIALYGDLEWKRLQLIEVYGCPISGRWI